MEEFLAKVGFEFDTKFVKLHVGTGDLDELLEFTWERKDLSPLVDAGVKPLLRNKLYRAILEERASRANRGAVVEVSTLEPLPVDSKPPSSPTGTPSSALLCEIENKEESLSEIYDHISSLSEGSKSSMSSQDASNLDASTSVDPADESSTTPRSSQAMVPGCEFQGNCRICGEHGHKGSECKADSGIAVADDFPLLGAAGNRREVPQAKHIAIAAGEEKAWAYSVDEREGRRAARKEAGEAQERARQIQDTTRQRARQTANLARQAPAVPLRTPQRAAQSASPQLVRQALAQTKDSRPTATTVGYGRQFGAYQPMSSAYQSSYVRGQPLLGCPKSCRICFPQG